MLFDGLMVFHFLCCRPVLPTQRSQDHKLRWGSNDDKMWLWLLWWVVWHVYLQIQLLNLVWLSVNYDIHFVIVWRYFRVTKIFLPEQQGNQATTKHRQEHHLNPSPKRSKNATKPQAENSRNVAYGTL